LSIRQIDIHNKRLKSTGSNTALISRIFEAKPKEKMKTKLALLLFSVFSINAFCQENKIEELVLSGTAKFEEANYEGAAADFTKAAELAPQESIVWYNLAMTNYMMELYDEATLNYTKVIELYPEYADAWFQRGLSKYNNGIGDGALADYSKALEIDTTLIEVLIQKAFLEILMKSYPEAIKDLTNYINKGGVQPAEAYCLRAGAYNRGYNWEKTIYISALEDLQKAIALGKNDVDVLYETGFAHQNLKELDKAIETYSKVIELNAEHYDAWHKRGLCKIDANYKGGCIDIMKAAELGSVDAQLSVDYYSCD
jgi:Tfp pilus assembly protein PilF